MAAKPALTPAQADRAVATYGSIQKAAKHTGVSRGAMAKWYRLAQAQKAAVPKSEIELPEFPSSEMPIDDVLDHLCKQSDTLMRGYASQDWFPITVKGNLPIGICVFGDLHLGDPGTDHTQVRKDFEIIAGTPGCYGLFIGDVANSWPLGSRLTAQYANQDTSAKTERRLAEWAMLNSGVSWLVWLLGNHDTWDNAGAEILARMAKKYGTKELVCHDWDAQFRVVFPSGVEYRIWAAHNFKGTSQYHNLHGLIKAALTRAEADVYVCGHFHNAGYHHEPYPERGLDPHFIRVAGYKKIDQHARVNGFTHPGKYSSCMLILDPAKKHVHVDYDLEKAAEYLTWLRKR